VRRGSGCYRVLVGDVQSIVQPVDGQFEPCPGAGSASGLVDDLGGGLVDGGARGPSAPTSGAAERCRCGSASVTGFVERDAENPVT